MMAFTDETQLTYEAVNSEVLDNIPQQARRILDLGCGSGSLGGVLKQRQHCEVVGVTFSEEEAALAKPRLDVVIVADLNTFRPTSLGRFDCIICSHILEHLFNPARLLAELHDSYSESGRLVVALPNVLFWRQRLLFLRGKFRYTEGGLMDRTHFRFFDWDSAGTLLHQAGYEIEHVVVNGHVPLPLVRHFLPQWLCVKLNQVAGRLSPGLFAPQFVLIGRASGR